MAIIEAETQPAVAMVQAGFDYGQIDEGVRDEVKEAARKIRAYGESLKGSMIAIGRRLREVKGMLQHGQFEAWIEAEFSISPRTAQNLMNVALVYGERKSETISFLPDAVLYALAAPSTPGNVRDEIERRAADGESITVADVRESKQAAVAKAAAKFAEPKPIAPRVVYLEPETKAVPHADDLSPVRPHVTNNSGMNEWYTPEDYIEASRLTLVTIDLDPATSAEANTVVRAKTIYTIEDDGLAQAWRGKVWLNPPYSSDLVSRFVDKLLTHFQAGDVPEAIVLVNNATETQWFQSLASYAACICFPAKRIRFWTPNRGTNSPLQGQAILYFGDNPTSFIDNFRWFGLLVDVRFGVETAPDASQESE